MFNVTDMQPNVIKFTDKKFTIREDGTAEDTKDNRFLSTAAHEAILQDKKLGEKMQDEDNHFASTAAAFGYKYIKYKTKYLNLLKNS